MSRIWIPWMLEVPDDGHGEKAMVLEILNIVL